MYTPHSEADDSRSRGTGHLGLDLHIKRRAPMGQSEGGSETMSSKKAKRTSGIKKSNRLQKGKSFQAVKPLTSLSYGGTQGTYTPQK
jgi:hypothetical protein